MATKSRKGEVVKEGDRITIKMPPSEARKHPRYYEAFNGKAGKVYKIWDFKGALYALSRGDNVSVELRSDDVPSQYIHVPISYCVKDRS